VLVRRSEALSDVGPPVGVDAGGQGVEDFRVREQGPVQDDHVHLEGRIIKSVEGVDAQHVPAGGGHPRREGVLLGASPVPDQARRPVPLDPPVDLTVQDGGCDGLVRVGHHDQLAPALPERVDLAAPLRRDDRLGRGRC
jgi:hypothetical protein